MMKFSAKKLFTLLLTAIIFYGCSNEVEFVNLVPPIAEAGAPQTIFAPQSSDSLVGSSTATNGPIVGHLWSLISGPNVPIIHSPSSSSTRISNLVAGSYIFQYAVIDSVGLTGVDTTSIKVIGLPNNPIQTLVVRPINNPDEALFYWTASGVATGVNFAYTETVAGTWTFGGELYLLRSQIKFNMNAIPSNANIVSAKLSLYSNPTPVNGNGTNANFGSNNAMYIERIATNWNSGVTWATQPFGDPSSRITIPHTNSSSLDLIDIDVTNQVSQMMVAGNYGFKLGLRTEEYYNIRNFASSRYPDSTKHPKLVIQYQ